MAKKVKKHPDEMSFLDHLEELRWHLIRATLAVLAIGIIAFIFKGTLFSIILGPKSPDFISYDILCKISQFFGAEKGCISNGEMEFVVQSRKLAGQFSIALWTSIMAGVVLGFPYIIYEFWKFVSPGLYEKERKTSRGFILISSILFFIGVTFGYFVVAPLSINFLATFEAHHIIENKFDIESYIALVRASVLASGFIFELPIICLLYTSPSPRD